MKLWAILRKADDTNKNIETSHIIGVYDNHELVNSKLEELNQNLEKRTWFNGANLFVKINYEIIEVELNEQFSWEFVTTRKYDTFQHEIDGVAHDMKYKGGGGRVI